MFSHRAEDFLRVLYAFVRRRVHAVEDVRDAEFFVLESTEGVVRQDLDLLHGLQFVDELPGRDELFVGVGEARYEDVADPHRDAVVTEVARTVEDVPVRPAGQGLMLLVVDFLDVEEDRVRDLGQCLELRDKWLFAGKRLRRGVEAGADAACLCLLEELEHEVDLYERVAAADGDAALLTPVLAVALCVVEELVRGAHVVALQGPGVRIVAVAAAHVTALQKDRISDARAVHGAEGLDGVNCTFDGFCHSSSLKNMRECYPLPHLVFITLYYRDLCSVLEITSSCCSLVRSMNLTA